MSMSRIEFFFVVVISMFASASFYTNMAIGSFTGEYEVLSIIYSAMLLFGSYFYFFKAFSNVKKGIKHMSSYPLFWLVAFTVATADSITKGNYFQIVLMAFGVVYSLVILMKTFNKKDDK